jgi:hypothetical protein
MMSKIKILFLLVLCVGLIGGAMNVSAQTGSDKVLVSAGGKTLKQSDVDAIIEFYEWASQTRFTSEQREQYSQLKAAEFRRNPAEAKKGNDQVKGFLPQINSSSPSEKERVRKAFNDNFIQQIRKATDDAEAQFLLGVYDAARGGNNGGETAANDANGAGDSENSSSGGDVSDLIGKWAWGRSGSTTYAAGGAMLGSNGSRHTYQFAANGAVEYTGIMNVMTGGCNMQIFKTMKGRANLSGGTLTINWQPATFTRDDSCSPSKNYTKKLPAETETFQIKFKSDYGQKQLCLTGKDETCYSRSE